MALEMGQRFHTDNPIRIKRGEFKGFLPHETGEDEFLTYLIIEGMTFDDYWRAIESGEREADWRERHPDRRVLTFDKLSDDQKGWAQARYPGHIHQDGKWWVDQEHPGVPKPVPSIIIDRSRGYENECECGEDADYEPWGTRIDGVELSQCQSCGEVVVLLDYIEIEARDVKVGDYLDLEGDPIADDGDEPNPVYEYEYQLVTHITPYKHKVRLHFETEAISFPMDHMLKRRREEIE